jgi:hypothetical protein
MTKQLDHQALVDLTRRWFALWTEADPQARSRQVADLWATNGAQVLVDPPQAMREAATELAFPAPRLEVRGQPRSSFSAMDTAPPKVGRDSGAWRGLNTSPGWETSRRRTTRS